ncbi:MAG: ATP-dependent protease ATPase subunit HslU [Sulfurovum sp.]|nr:ATP-dependent protease ATPase subunit HslU [Sulfurovum sp.]MCB4745686.1 ATP-dependent protease ATPase subunit HslU [Sulfurovum sp.]MCB4749564.1 ATP-dependent protease ATPase subunit HslU [Sulfurovum sp.]MCB4750932.1 ATP-dependent protease ATPase subunit HslU [Sulfurovum sp.]MCB4753174.1 ATP-dependent protease ATPase subunit HslU [Sulfurovum sp.]
MDNLTPKEIVTYLDRYVIGQNSAKRTIAVALRNRYRRMQLSEEMQQDVIPKNILMIGSTGVGKTEIARRLAKMMQLPFIKVEASKYTEVGFVGRDVESMIRDLAIMAMGIVRETENIKHKEKIANYIENKIIEKLLPPLPVGASEQKQAEYDASFLRMQEKFAKGELDHLMVKVNMPRKADLPEDGLPPQMIQVQESIVKVLGGYDKKGPEKEIMVSEAKKILEHEASEELLDEEKLKELAREKVEKGGIVFLDEVDKIAVSSTSQSRQDPSKEGVQRDLLPIVEGSTVNTKLGSIKTDHILFIAAGAFHLSKPSDLIPELQGRFPLRVELESLNEEALYRILTEPKSSLIRQYQALLAVEEVKLIFEEEAIRAIAHYSLLANEKTEDIGARRLHTVMEKIVEEISFEADARKGETYTVTKILVEEKVGSVVEDQDMTRYIL